MADIKYLRDRYEDVEKNLCLKLNYETSIASSGESRLGITLFEAGLQQNQSVKRLAQLAFIFIPLRFITSVFGININVLNGTSADWWTVIIGTVIVYAIVGLSYLGVLGLEKLGS
jgi:Mg2+ and Co2+ transporter CorA